MAWLSAFTLEQAFALGLACGAILVVAIAALYIAFHLPGLVEWPMPVLPRTRPPKEVRYLALAARAFLKRLAAIGVDMVSTAQDALDRLRGAKS